MDIGGRADWQRGWPERFAVAGKIIWFYLGKLAWPHPLIFIYPRLENRHLKCHVLCPSGGRDTDIRGLVVLAARLGEGNLVRVHLLHRGAVARAGPGEPLFRPLFIRRRPFSVFGLDGDSGLGGRSDRAAAGGFGLWCRWSGDVLCLVLLAVLSILTWRQSRMYRDNETLYRTTLDWNPTCWFAQNNLGKMLIERGEVNEAIIRYQQAMGEEPRVAEPHNNMGLACMKGANGQGRRRVPPRHRSRTAVRRGSLQPRHCLRGIATTQCRHNAIPEGP